MHKFELARSSNCQIIQQQAKLWFMLSCFRWANLKGCWLWCWIRGKKEKLQEWMQFYYSDQPLGPLVRFKFKFEFEVEAEFNLKRWQSDLFSLYSIQTIQLFFSLFFRSLCTTYIYTNCVSREQLNENLKLSQECPPVHPFSCALPFTCKLSLAYMRCLSSSCSSPLVVVLCLLAPPQALRKFKKSTIMLDRLK